MTRTVVVVDDHASFRRAATALLESAGLSVVGEAASGLEGLSVCTEANPDLVLLDIQLPDIDGFEVCRRLHEIGARPRILLVSSRAAADYGSRVDTSSADGFVSKSELTRSALEHLLGGLW